MLNKRILLIFCFITLVFTMSCGSTNTQNSTIENKSTLVPSPTTTASPAVASLPGSLAITIPADNESVDQHPFVEGNVPDPAAKLWVIVHPMEVGVYWVQPAVSPRENGKWKVQIFVGRPGQDSGKHFEIRAVANPKKDLKEGDELTAWPDAQWRSEVVEVVRK